MEDSHGKGRIEKMTLKLIRIALFLITLIGFILAMQTAESDFILGRAILSVCIMLVGMVSFGMSYAVTIRKESK